MRPFHAIRQNQVLVAVILAVAIANLWLIYKAAPVVPHQDMAQKIFYYHVPLAWNAFLAYLLVAAAGAAYLITRQPRWDCWALAGTEVGTGCTESSPDGNGPAAGGDSKNIFLLALQFYPYLDPPASLSPPRG